MNTLKTCKTSNCLLFEILDTQFSVRGLREILIGLAVLWVPCLHIRVALAEDGFLQNHSLSPHKSFYLLFPHPYESCETWLISSQDPKKRFRLTEPPSASDWQDGNGQGAPIIYVSPDDKYIVWEIRETSEISNLVLYRRGTGLHYHVIGSVSDLIGKRYYALSGLDSTKSDGNNTSGAYGRASVLAWKDGSRCLLVEMLIKHIASFQATYYTDTGRIILHVKDSRGQLEKSP